MDNYLIYDRLYRAHFPDQAAYVKASTQMAHQRLVDKMELLGIGRQELEGSDFREKYRVAKDLTFDPDTRILVEVYQIVGIELFLVKWTQDRMTILEHS